MDEQPLDEGIPPEMCHQAVGLLPSESNKFAVNYKISFFLSFFSFFNSCSLRKMDLPSSTYMSVRHC